MRFLFFLFSLSVGNTLFSQVLPAWTTSVPTDYSGATCTHDGGIFVSGTGTSVVNCSAGFAYGVYLSNSGSINWERAYDTTNCDNDFAYSTAVANAQHPCFAITTNNSSTLDTGRTVIYNAPGNVLADSIWEFTNGGGGAPMIGNMGDNYFYYSQAYNVFKTDSLGHTVWTYYGPDSVSRSTVLFDSIHSNILISSQDIRSSDWETSIKALDTSGNLLFTTSHNFYTTPYETPIMAWLSPGYKIYGFVKDNTLNGQLAFGLDTAGNLLWQRTTPGYLHSAYDSVHNVLHYTTSITNQMKRCYKIDCSTGALLDSITIDSCGLQFPLCKVDKFGNVYLCYALTGASPSTYRIDQYRPDYTFNWEGIFIDNTGGNLPKDLFINDSCQVFLINGSNNTKMISKYYPPVLNSSTSELVLNGLDVYPNPVSSSLFCTFSFEQGKSYQYQITNVEGKLALSGHFNGSRTVQIDISSLPSSLYFICILNQNGERITQPKKIVKL